jgi:hypothetical protein
MARYGVAAVERSKPVMLEVGIGGTVDYPWAAEDRKNAA